MTYAQIKTEIRRRLAEATPGVVWTDADVAEAANLGYAEISDATEWHEAWVDIALLNDRPYYDLRRLIGEAFLSIAPAFDRQTNRWLIPSAVRQLDAHDTRWERVTGEPMRIFLRGLWWLGFYPRIQSDVGRIKQYYTSLPDPLVNDTDVPGFPETYHGGVVDFALTDLWAQDGETALALAAFQAYLKTEADLLAWRDGRAGGPMLNGFTGTSEVAR